MILYLQNVKDFFFHDEGLIKFSSFFFSKIAEAYTLEWGYSKNSDVLRVAT